MTQNLLKHKHLKKIFMHINKTKFYYWSCTLKINPVAIFA